MTRRWRDPAAFRAAPVAVDPRRPTHRQALVLALVLVLVAGAAAIVSAVVRPDTARAFDLVNGSVFIPDYQGPVAIDLASGKPTVRLVQADAQVGAAKSSQLAVTPLEDGTLLLNSQTGEFNVVESTGFVVKHSGGVPLPRRAGVTGAAGYAFGSLAYIEQTSRTGTSVYLVGPSTVQTAMTTAGQVRPRAYATMPALGSLAAGGAVSAGGKLWLLARNGTSRNRIVRTLSLPRNSRPGVKLRQRDLASVAGPAALAAVSPDGGGPASVVLAGDDHVTVWSTGGTRTLPFASVANLDLVLPATNQQGFASFLLHGSNGWSIVSVDAGGNDLRGPYPLRGLDPSATLATPAASAGRLYTMAENTGRLVTVGTDGVTQSLPGISDYPLARADGKSIESPTLGFADTAVVARSSRVIIDSPSHVNAVVAFTDGSRHTTTINKYDAVTVSASGGAEALTRSRLAAGGAQHGNGGKSRKKPSRRPTGSGTNNTIDCKTTTQKPHVPFITGHTAGSRSVALTWTYPVLSTQDCVPSTYVVTVQSLTGTSPAAPQPIKVQGEQGLTVAGLYPDTSYRLTVTAYINGQGTASSPVQVLTEPEGPASPTGVRVSTDANGNWNVTWRSCGTVGQGCVPAQSWTVTPTYCDGRGVSTPLAPISVLADPTSRVQPPAQQRATGDLLGRGLSFTVEGVGNQGQIGAPSAASPCVIGSVPPDAAALQLSAATPTTTTLGQAAATELTLDLGDDPIRDLGGVGTVVTFRLTGPDGTLTRDVVFRGNETTLSTRFSGVQAGSAYRASVVVTPPGNAAPLTMPAQPVTISAAWPSALSVDSSCPADTNYATSCALAVTIDGLSSAQSDGEHFDVTETLSCSNAQEQFSQSDVALGSDGTTIPIGHVDQADTGLYGGCSVAVSLLEHDPPAPAVFGGVASPTVSASLTLSTPTIAASDFSLAWAGSAATLTFTGGGADALAVQAALARTTGDWSATLYAPNAGLPCGAVGNAAAPGSDDAAALVVPLSDSCLRQYGNEPGNWTVAVTWTNTVLGVQVPAIALGIAGPVPAYPSCDLDPSNLTASWQATRAAGVDVSFADPNALAGCSNWMYQFLDPQGDACGTAQSAAGPDVDVTVPDDCDTSAGTTGWTLQITYSDTAGDGQPAVPLAIDGRSPTS